MFERVARRFNFPVVVVPDSADTPEGVMRHLVSVLAASGQLADGAAGEAVASLLKRESPGPTALGGGAALPRGFTTAVAAPAGVVGQVPHGVRWDGAGQQPVTAVCLLLCPGSCEGLSDYMKMLEAAGREVAARE